MECIRTGGDSAEFIDVPCNRLVIISLRAAEQSLVKWEAFFLSSP